VDPAATLGQALRFSVTVLIGVLMGARLSVPRLAVMVFFVTLAGVGVSVLLSLAGVGFALAPGGDARGIYFHKNMLGGQAVLLFALSAVLLLRGRLVPFALVGCIVAVLGTMLSDSATSAAVTGMLIVGLPLLAALAMRPLAAATMVFTALLFACVIALLFVHFGTDPYTEALRLLDRDPTLTGRWDLWDAALAQIGDRPVLGYGFAAFWTAGADWRTEAELGDVGHFHNTFLEVAVQLGLLGVALTALLLLLAAVTWMGELVRRRDVILAWPPALWVLLMIAGLAEVVLVVKHALFQILFVAVFVQIALLRGWRPAAGGGVR
jgi:exopolysaccharide production protein ExoQ